MKGIDQKLADRVDRVFHAPMQAARRSTEPAHYFQHGPLLVYAVTHLAGSAGVTRSARAYRFGGLHAGGSVPRASDRRMSIAASGPRSLIAPAGVRLDAGADVSPQRARMRSALRRRWQ